MQYRTLGGTDLKVSPICLGTMTFGEQNTEQQAHRQLDLAVDAGINFIDTAEMYPVPPRGKTQGHTESHIGTWIQKRGHREDIILATKVAGPSAAMRYLRDKELRLDRYNILKALDGSLRRLGTDYIDLYQVHWPDRSTNYFGQLGYLPVEEDSVPIEDTLHTLNELVEAGKIRYIGISNETPWGVMQYLSIAEKKRWPRIVSIQNPYNLLNRTFETGLAEISHREKIGLLAYSPLGFGVLSGKYINGARPNGSRLQRFTRFDRYTNQEGESATVQYVELAKRHGLDPTQMALAFVNSRPFTTATIIGATNTKQLESNLASIDVTLPDDVLKGIESIHERQPNPCP